MIESRSDSLAVELKRIDLFDEYFSWWLQSRPSFADRIAWLEEKGVGVSNGSVHRLHQSPEAAVWRNAEAARARASMDANLPKDINVLIRKALLDQRFNAVLGDLGHKALMDHVASDQTDEMIKLRKRQADQKDIDQAQTQERIDIESCKRFIIWAKNEQAMEIANSNLSNADKIAALRQTFFADVDAMAASGKVVLPKR